MNVVAIDVYHQFHYEVLNSYQEESDCNYIYAITGGRHWHGDREVCDNLRHKLFSTCRSNIIADFIYADSILELSSIPNNLSGDIINKYAHLELGFLKMSDRHSALYLSVHQRRKYYLLILNYFLDIIHNNKVDVCICFDTPHSMHSSLLYRMLQMENVPVIRLEHHYLQNHCLVIGGYMPLLPDQYSIECSEEELYSDLPDYTKQALSTMNTHTEHLIQMERRRIVNDGLLGAFASLIGYTYKCITNIGVGLLSFAFKKEELHFMSLNGVTSRVYYRLLMNMRVYALYRQLRAYRKLSTVPDLERDFIYFGLHMQPEKTTMPMGGAFDHQLTAINMIASALPNGWKLYVKDHPNQFNNKKIVNSNFRDIRFYRAIARLENVELVALTVQSEVLIQKSKLVATITGTLGWEALQSGKTALVFGEAYYVACGAVRKVSSAVECSNAIDDLLKLKSSDVKRLLYQYLHYYTNHGYLINASNWESRIEMGDLTREEVVGNITDGFMRYVDTTVGGEIQNS